MEQTAAAAAFAALGQPTRLAVLRRLIAAGADGLPAGGLAADLNVLPNTLSANLAVLSRSGLIRGARQGRSIVYRADMDGLRALLGFLLEDCCGGRAELCAPLLDLLTRAPAGDSCTPRPCPAAAPAPAAAPPDPATTPGDDRPDPLASTPTPAPIGAHP